MLRAILVLLICSIAASAQAQQQQFRSVRLINEKLAGRIDDYTHNHCEDNRIYSSLLGRKQDVYVYVPPGYDPSRGYPLVLWLHGSFGDEHAFLDTAQLVWLDEQIRSGCIPPMIVACADGICTGRNCMLAPHSFYANGCCGAFETNLVSEVLTFVQSRYAVCPARGHHALVGVSAGGSGAMRIAMKYRH
jgi:enterochelin esterase-like enzyme